MKHNRKNKSDRETGYRKRCRCGFKDGDNCDMCSDDRLHKFTKPEREAEHDLRIWTEEDQHKAEEKAAEIRRILVLAEN